MQLQIRHHQRIPTNMVALEVTECKTKLKLTVILLKILSGIFNIYGFCSTPSIKR